MTGEERLLEVKIPVPDQEEAQKIAEEICPEHGWAIEESGGAVVLKLYVKSPPQALEGLGLPYSVAEAPRWEERFRESFRGVQAGPFFVRPPWVAPKEGLMDVVISPGSGFGTGEHPTTCGMLRLLSGLSLSRKRVLDVGCGSGILSIAAAKLGAKSALALDIDPLAISNARENLVLNAVEDRVTLVNGTPCCLRGGFDVVLANIDFFTLVSMRDELTRLCKEELLISGFLSEDAESILSLYLSCFRVAKAVELSGWVSLHLKKTGVVR